ncbi:MAG: hypothetical protein CMJ72_10030 [Planctomycetaceae bacterium]|nr:hypothetical protein [Planctomycetaceae bacterium]
MGLQLGRFIHGEIASQNIANQGKWRTGRDFAASATERTEIDGLCTGCIDYANHMFKSALQHV